MCLSPAADGGRARRGGTQGPSDLRGARGPRVLDWVPHGTDEGGGFCLQERDEATWGPACEGRGGWQSLQPNPCHFAKGQHVLRQPPVWRPSEPMPLAGRPGPQRVPGSVTEATPGPKEGPSHGPSSEKGAPGPRGAAAPTTPWGLGVGGSARAPGPRSL